MWKDIEAKASLSAEEEELATKKHAFTLILSADYQLSKFNPCWGGSAQPGSIYYLQKVSHLVDYRDGQQHYHVISQKDWPKKWSILSLSSKAISTRSLSFIYGLGGFFCLWIVWPTPTRIVTFSAREWN